MSQDRDNNGRPRGQSAPSSPDRSPSTSPVLTSSNSARVPSRGHSGAFGAGGDGPHVQARGNDLFSRVTEALRPASIDLSVLQRPLPGAFSTHDGNNDTEAPASAGSGSTAVSTGDRQEEDRNKPDDSIEALPSDVSPYSPPLTRASTSERERSFGDFNQSLEAQRSHPIVGRSGRHVTFKHHRRAEASASAQHSAPPAYDGQQDGHEDQHEHDNGGCLASCNGCFSRVRARWPARNHPDVFRRFLHWVLAMLGQICAMLGWVFNLAVGADRMHHHSREAAR